MIPDEEFEENARKLISRLDSVPFLSAMDRLTIFVFLVVLISGAYGHSSKCTTNHRHHAAFGQWANLINETHKLSLMMPSLHHHAFRTVTDEELFSETQLPLAGSTECPDTPASTLDEPIMGRSLCPWYWKMNYNSNRIPAMLPEAVCRCRRAVVSAQGLVPYECQPMTMHVRVLQLDESCEQFQERTIEIAVACVSVFQPTVRLNKIVGVQRILNPERPQFLQEIK